MTMCSDDVCFCVQKGEPGEKFNADHVFPRVAITADHPVLLGTNRPQGSVCRLLFVSFCLLLCASDGVLQCGMRCGQRLVYFLNCLLLW